MKLLSQLHLPSIKQLPSLPSASGMRGELRLAKQALQRAGRSVRRHFLQQPVPVTAPHQGSAQTAEFMNPAERWNSFSKVAQIAFAISRNVRSAAGDQNSTLSTLADKVDVAADLLLKKLHDIVPKNEEYIIDVNNGKQIANNELSQLWAAIQVMDGCATLPKEVGGLICDFNDLSGYLLNETAGKAMCAAPKISDAYMQSIDIRDLGFLHDLIRDEDVQEIVDRIEANLGNANAAVKIGDSALAYKCLSEVKDLYVQLKQHLRNEYLASAVEGHCTAIEQRLAFFED